MITLSKTLGLIAPLVALLIAQGASGGTLYVSNYKGNNVLRYDTTTGQGTVFASGGAIVHPSGITVSPDGKVVYVVGLDNNVVTRLDASTGQVLGTFTIPSSVLSVAAGIALSPDGKTLYMAGDLSLNVLRVDASTGGVLGNFAAPGGPQQIAVSPDGKTLYVSAVFAGPTSTGNILRLDSTTGAAVGTPLTSFSLYGPVGVALSADGSTLFVTNQTSAKVVRFDTATGRETRSDSIAAFAPLSAVLSSDGASLFTVSYADSAIYSFDTATAATTPLASGGPLNGPLGLALLPSPAVPEPSSLILVGLGGLGTIAYGWWRRVSRSRTAPI
jgi:DNA-binding beta-propeller fold protein YncE